MNCWLLVWWEVELLKKRKFQEKTENWFLVKQLIKLTGETWLAKIEYISKMFGKKFDGTQEVALNSYPEMTVIFEIWIVHSEHQLTFRIMWLSRNWRSLLVVYIVNLYKLVGLKKIQKESIQRIKNRVTFKWVDLTQ